MERKQTPKPKPKTYKSRNKEPSRYNSQTESSDDGNEDDNKSIVSCPGLFAMPALTLHNMSHVMRKALFMPYANNKGADQPAHAHSLISAIVVHCLDSIILILAKSKISKKLIEKSRECHTHKPQPTPDTKRKRKMTETNMYKTNV